MSEVIIVPFLKPEKIKDLSDKNERLEFEKRVRQAIVVNAANVIRLQPGEEEKFRCAKDTFYVKSLPPDDAPDNVPGMVQVIRRPSFFEELFSFGSSRNEVHILPKDTHLVPIGDRRRRFSLTYPVEGMRVKYAVYYHFGESSLLESLLPQDSPPMAINSSSL